jgi:hypothetical protein
MQVANQWPAMKETFILHMQGGQSMASNESNHSIHQRNGLGAAVVGDEECASLVL